MTIIRKDMNFRLQRHHPTSKFKTAIRCRKEQKSQTMHQSMSSPSILIYLQSIYIQIYPSNIYCYTIFVKKLLYLFYS
jgi:hypothetical protein